MTKNIQNIKQEPIMLDLDKPRKYFLGMRGYAMLAEEYGTVQKAQEAFFKSIIKLDENGNAMAADITTDLLRAILVFAEAGLNKYNPELAKEDLEDIIDTSTNTFYEIIRGITYCFGMTLPKQEDSENPQKASRAKKTGLGNTSTQSPEAV